MARVHSVSPAQTNGMCTSIGRWTDPGYRPIADYALIGDAPAAGFAPFRPTRPPPPAPTPPTRMS